MQPSNLKKRRSVTKLSEKDLADPRCSNYALTTHEQDSDGGVETKIFKVICRSYLIKTTQLLTLSIYRET